MREPHTLRDSFFPLRTRFSGSGLKQEIDTALVHEGVAHTEGPIELTQRDMADEIGKSGFFQDLAMRGVTRGLAVLQMALGKAPVAMAIQNEEILGNSAKTSEHDPTGTDLLAIRWGHTQKTENLKYLRGFSRMSESSVRSS